MGGRDGENSVLCTFRPTKCSSPAAMPPPPSGRQRVPMVRRRRGGRGGEITNSFSAGPHLSPDGLSAPRAGPRTVRPTPRIVVAHCWRAANAGAVSKSRNTHRRPVAPPVDQCADGFCFTWACVVGGARYRPVTAAAPPIASCWCKSVARFTRAAVARTRVSTTFAKVFLLHDRT